MQGKTNPAEPRGKRDSWEIDGKASVYFNIERRAKLREIVESRTEYFTGTNQRGEEQQFEEKPSMSEIMGEALDVFYEHWVAEQKSQTHENH